MAGIVNVGTLEGKVHRDVRLVIEQLAAHVNKLVPTVQTQANQIATIQATPTTSPTQVAAAIAAVPTTENTFTAQQNFSGGLNVSQLPTADPHVKYQAWSNNGVLTISAG
jgi:hypothetical protein